MAQSRIAATLSVVRIINLRAIRRHTLRALLAALSLGGGVAVVVAVLIESTSVSTAVDDVGYRIAGPAPLRIVGAATRGGIAPAVIDAARQVPGVAATVPVIRAVTLLRSGGHDTFVLALGIDCSAQWIIDPKVCQPGQREPPMMATSTTLVASLGPTATLETDVGDLLIPALQPISQLDTVNNGRVIVVPLSVAKAQFARADSVDLVYLQVADGANPSEVRARLADRLGPGFRVLTRGDPARGFDVNTVLLPLLGIFALVAVGVGVILIAQITRMSVEERRREIAIAAALGASPLTAVSGFLFEAALLGVLGSLIGIVLGIVIARPVVAAASELTQQFLGVNVPVVIQPGVIVVGLVTGVVLAVLAAILPSLSASKTAIATELSGRAAQENAKPGGIWPKAVALLVVGFGGVTAATLATTSGGLQPWQATVTDAAVVVAVVGLLSATAYLSAQAITSIKPRPHRAHSATLAVALSGLRANGSRTTAIAGAVAVPVAVAVLLSGFLVAINRGVADVARAQADGRLVLTTTQFTDFGSMDAKFSPDTMAKLAALPGVDTVERLAEIETTLPNGSLAFVRAEDRPTFPFPVLAGRLPQQSVDANQLIVGGILARQNGIRVGDTLLLGSGARATKVVVGTILATPEVGGRRIQMSYRLAEQIFGPEPAALVFLKPAAGSSVPKLGEELGSQAFNQPVRATDAAGYEHAVASGEARFLAPLNSLKYGLLAIAFISVSSTLLLTGMRRRREIALIQALGATGGKVFAVTTVEAVIASAVGAVFSAALSVAILEAVRRAAIVNVGSDSPLVFPVSEALLYAALATTAAILAALIPAWRSTQTAPSTALRDE
jgi:putative ABC transport system permease protein